MALNSNQVASWLACILSGVLLALCYHPFGFGELVWVWQVPILLVVWLQEHPEKSHRGWWAFRRGYLTGLVFFGINAKWLHNISIFAPVGMAAYLAIYFGLWAMFAATVGRLLREQITPPLNPMRTDNVRSEKLQKLMEENQKASLIAPSLHAMKVALYCAVCWVALEWLRGSMFAGFGWNGLGVAMNTEIGFNLVQIADVVGVAGVAFVPVFCTCIGVATIARFRAEMGKGQLRPHIDFGVAMMLLIATFFYGLHSRNRHPLDEPKEILIGVVQGNVPLEVRWDPAQAESIYELYERETARLTHADLIIWSETCLPDHFFYPTAQRFLNQQLAKGEFDLILGSEEVRWTNRRKVSVMEGEVNPELGPSERVRDMRQGDPDQAAGSLEFTIETQQAYNSMMLLNGSTENAQFYQKIHLVPFGEFVPFNSILYPILSPLAPDLPTDAFDEGTEFKRFQMTDHDIEIIPTICIEDTVGNQVRKFLGDGPEFILNVTNDAWFKESEAAEQHLANARFRAIELRRPLVRCANTGVTCIVNRFGNLQDPMSPNPNHERKLAPDGSIFVQASATWQLEVDSNPSTTIYSRYGDWFAISMMIVTLILAAPGLGRFGKRRIAWFRRKRKS